MRFNKLVRDKIPDIIRKKGNTPITHIASDDEYYMKLKEKLQEEVDEFKISDSPEEIADIFEVIHAIIEHRDIDMTNLEIIRMQKELHRGGFKERIILDGTEDKVNYTNS